jgi:parvulin-like peptidyl-prolyl isomerase
MKMSRITLVLVALAILVVAGCGGTKTAKLSTKDVAVVGGTSISKSQFDDLMSTAQASFKQQRRAFPKQGTAAYATIKSQAVTLLVQQAEREEKAKNLGITIADSQIATRLAQIKKQYFQGKDSAYKAQLKKQGLSEAQVRSDIRAQLVSEALFKKVTGDVKVTPAEIHQYYATHPTQYQQPESRQVRHILVKKKALADSIYAQLKGGGDFAKLAKKYSLDTVSAAQGGNYNAIKGQSVAPFDKVAFALKTNEISKPVQTQYGWHVIQALSAIKPAGRTPEKQATDQIRQQLLQTKRSAAVNEWAKGLTKEYCKSSRIKYQAGFQPSPDPCVAAAAAATATTSPTTTG